MLLVSGTGVSPQTRAMQNAGDGWWCEDSTASWDGSGWVVRGGACYYDPFNGSGGGGGGGDYYPPEPSGGGGGGGGGPGTYTVPRDPNNPENVKCSGDSPARYLSARQDFLKWKAENRLYQIYGKGEILTVTFVGGGTERYIWIPGTMASPTAPGEAMLARVEGSLSCHKP